MISPTLRAKVAGDESVIMVEKLIGSTWKAGLLAHERFVGVGTKHLALEWAPLRKVSR